MMYTDEKRKRLKTLGVGSKIFMDTLNKPARVFDACVYRSPLFTIIKLELTNN